MEMKMRRNSVAREWPHVLRFRVAVGSKLFVLDGFALRISIDVLMLS